MRRRGNSSPVTALSKTSLSRPKRRTSQLLSASSPLICRQRPSTDGARTSHSSRSRAHGDVGCIPPSPLSWLIVCRESSPRMWAVSGSWPLLGIRVNRSKFATSGEKVATSKILVNQWRNEPSCRDQLGCRRAFTKRGQESLSVDTIRRYSSLAKFATEPLIFRLGNDPQAGATRPTVDKLIFINLLWGSFDIGHRWCSTPDNRRIAWPDSASVMHSSVRYPGADRARGDPDRPCRRWRPARLTRHASSEIV